MTFARLDVRPYDRERGETKSVAAVFNDLIARVRLQGVHQRINVVLPCGSMFHRMISFEKESYEMNL